ncbi:MAG: hypothetical protein ACE5OR_09130 [bacterium]
MNERTLLAIFCLGVLTSPKVSAQEVIFSDDFASYADSSSGAPTWTVTKGEWLVVDGQYVQQSNEYDCGAMLNLFIEESFELEAKYKFVEGDPGGGLFFSSEDYGDTEFAHMIRLEMPNSMLVGYFKYGQFNDILNPRVDIKKDRWHVLKLAVNRDSEKFSIYVDGTSVAEDIDLIYYAGYVGLQSSGSKSFFDDVRITVLPTGEKKQRPLYWIRNFALSQFGSIIIPDRNSQAIYRMHTKLKGPTMMIRLRREVDFADIFINQREAVFILDSKHQTVFKLASQEGPQKTVISLVDYIEPIALDGDAGGNFFILDRARSRLEILDPQGALIASVDSLSLGGHILDHPVDLALEDDKVYVANEGTDKISLFAWDPDRRDIRFERSITYGHGVIQKIELTEKGIYASISDEVRLFDRQGNRLGTFRGEVAGGMLPWAVEVDSEGDVYIADFMNSRIIITDPELSEPQISITFLQPTRAVVEWETPRSIAFKLRVNRGTSIFAELTETGFLRRHRFKISDLSPSTVYSVRIEPTFKLIPEMREYSRPIYFVTPPEPQKTQFWRLPVAVLVYANVVDTSKQQTEWPPMLALSEEEIERIRKEIEDGIKFYWMNSHMKFFLDATYIVVEDHLRRADIFGDDPYYWPIHDRTVQTLEQAGHALKDFPSVVIIGCLRSYDTDKKEWLFEGRGGGFTQGIGNQEYGLSWWKATHRNHNAGNDWLFVHEFHHQVDALFRASGYPEYWFNHIAPVIGTAADFGEHFDANAHILREWPVPKWFVLKWGQIDFANDTDEDGIPDDDPRLPMDEKRLASSPKNTDTDGDGLSDLEELNLSNWIINGWGETYGGQQYFPRLTERDSDGDGLDDPEDPYPQYAMTPEIHYATPRVDGTIQDDEYPLFINFQDPRVRAKVYASWNEEYLSLAYELERKVPLKIMVDANGDGWFFGRNNYRLYLEPADTGGYGLKVEIVNSAEPRRWPFDDRSIIASEDILLKTDRKESIFVAEVGIPKNGYTGLDLVEGEVVGFDLGFKVAMDERDHERYVTPFEPNRFFDVRLVK